MPPQSPEDDRRCDGHPDCDPGTDKHARAMRVVVLIAAHRLFLSQLSVPPMVCVRVHAQHDRSDGSVVKALAAIRMPSTMVR